MKLPRAQQAPFEFLVWSSPLLGASSALGIDDTDGHVTTARPIRLGTVRNADGDSAEGDGLRREADG